MNERIIWKILLLAQIKRVQLIAVINACITFTTFGIPEAPQLFIFIFIFLALLLVFKIATHRLSYCPACLSCPHTVANNPFLIAIAGQPVSVIDTEILAAARAPRARVVPQTKVFVNLSFAPRFVLDLCTLRHG
jgi:hypothetical protein